jgi:uncharacterized membrane protein YuzA (DUF378 family)
MPASVLKPEEAIAMKALDIITLILVIIGGINWGLVGLLDFNLVTTIFGEADGDGLPIVTKIVYIVVGLAALWQLMPLARMLSNNGRM